MRSLSRLVSSAVAVVLVPLALVACSSGESSTVATTTTDDTTTTAAPTTTAVTTIAPTDTSATSSASTTTTAPPTTTTVPPTEPDDGTVRLEITVVGGVSTGVDGRVEVPLGSPVELTVTADVADEVHVHGYDIFGDVTPAAPAVISFAADIPGLFEVELEDARLLLVELQVS